MLQEMGDIFPPAGEKVVQAEHLAPGLDEPVTEMGSQEAGAAGDDNFFHAASL
jgi:hypothetical protein